MTLLFNPRAHHCWLVSGTQVVPLTLTLTEAQSYCQINGYALEIV